MRRKQFFALVVIPAAIAAGIAIIFFLANFSIFFERTSEDYLERLSYPSKDDRWYAALNLGIRRYRPAIPKLLEALGDPAPEVRYHAACALTNMRAREAVPKLVSMASGRGEEVRVRVVAIECLMEFGGDEVLDALQKTLTDDAWEVRQASVRALGELRAERAQEAIRDRLSDLQNEVRWNAALALTRFGDASGLSVLHEMLEEPQETVVRNALEALAILARPESLEPLRTLRGRVEGSPLAEEVGRVIRTIEGREKAS